MSYTEICDKFETVSLHMQNGSESLTALCNFFKTYKKSFEIFNNHLAKLNESFHIDLPKEGSMDTLSMALVSLNSHIKKFILNNTNLYKNLQLDLIEPLEFFSQNFCATNQSQLGKALYPYRELKRTRDQLHKIRQKYFISSETAEKATQRAEYLSQTESDKEKRDKSQRDAIYYRTQTNSIFDGYIQLVQEVNNK